MRSIPEIPGAISAIVAKAKRAFEVAPNELRAKRMAICHECPHYKQDPIQRCGKCGCPLVSKVTPLHSHCPAQPSRW